MGLSSSQARLLTLTGRMHDIEYKAQKLEAEKLQLANETRQVYESYLQVLEASKIQNKIITADGTISYTDTTYNKLINTKIDDHTSYILRDTDTGKAYVEEQYKGAYDASNKTLGGFLKELNEINSGSSAGYISITTPEQLKNLSNSNGNYKLDCDITVSNWDGITNFSGTFDGNGHTVKITNGTSGLFKNTNGATIKNVNADVNINSDSHNIGGLIGEAKNTNITNCASTGNVRAEYGVSGLIGCLKGSCTLSNCESSAEVYSTYISPSNGYAAEDYYDYKSYAGGLIGYTSSSGITTNVTLNDCISNGDVKTEYWVAGGFIGYISSNLTANNCVSNSNVYGNYTGKGDSYNPVQNGRNVIPGLIASFCSGTANGYSVQINDCNALGKVNANGDISKTHFDDFVWGSTSPAFNNFHSSLKNSSYSVPTKNVYIPDTNPSSYPNLSAADVEKAISIFSLLDQTKGGVCVPEGREDDYEWFSNIVLNGFAIISQVDTSNDKEYKIHDVSVATDTNLQEVQDKKNLRKEEAKYEADLHKIDLKDRKYDRDLAALDSERNAIKQEIDTLKTVAKENVERTFRLFS